MEREQKLRGAGQQIADARLEDYKINFPLQTGKEEKREEQRRGERKRSARSFRDAAVITTS